jgi:hypothetical protein
MAYARKCGSYGDNRLIGFSTSGEHYADNFNLFSLRFWLPGLVTPKKRGRPKGSRDSYKRLRSCSKMASRRSMVA